MEIKKDKIKLRCRIGIHKWFNEVWQKSQYEEVGFRSPLGPDAIDEYYKKKCILCGVYKD